MLYSHPIFLVSRREFFVIFGLNFIYALAFSAAATEAAACVSCDIGCANNEGASLTPCMMTEYQRQYRYENATNQSSGYQYGSLIGKLYRKEIPNFMWGAEDVTYPPPVRWCCLCERVGLSWFVKNLYF